MRIHTRARLIWTIIAVTAAYAVFNLLHFATGGTFGPGWLLAGLVVYGFLFASSILLALTERPETATEATVAADEQPEPARPGRELLFQDEGATIVRESDAQGNAEIVIVADGSSSSIRDIERAVDEAYDEPGRIVKRPASKKPASPQTVDVVEEPRQV